MAGSRTEKPGFVLREPPFADNDVLVADELRNALKLSESQWWRVAAKLPVTYALGPRSPRYIYGEVVKALAVTQINRVEEACV